MKPLSYHFFGYIFRDVVETSHNLAVDAAGVAGHMAPKSADAAIIAPELAPVDAGEVEETHPQVVADCPSQLIRDVCNCICATKTTSEERLLVGSAVILHPALLPPWIAVL
jgi:hypothetical protein